MICNATLILSVAAGPYKLAGYAHIEFQFSLVTFLKALKAACLQLRNVEAHLQKAKMEELVAATGMWKYRYDNLKRDMMEQVKGMGDKMDWDTYYSGGGGHLSMMSKWRRIPNERVPAYCSILWLIILL